MKRLLVLALFAAMTMAMAPAETQAKDNRLAVDGAFLMPLGDWGDITGMGVGALLRYEYLMSPQLTITGRVGYIYGLAKDVGGAEFSMSEIPIMGGARYYFKGYTSKKREGLYAGGELGLVMIKSKAEVCFMDQCASGDSSDTKLGMTAGVGYEISGLDINASAFLPSVADAGDMFGVLVTVGYSFFAF